ncbi:MAG: DUF2202 domain-containing protein [Verrucomicrobiaceae bacterium]|nr:DUF2202 domain-containing protein [Verrucomicrobiaceae bacterium]
MKTLTTLAAAFALLSAPFASAQQAGGGRASVGLTAEAKQALMETLAGPEGEFAAHALYSAILKKFGDVQPYANIREAETRHIQALKRQFEKYGVPIPDDKFAGKVTPPETLLQAAKDGIEAEKKNVALYDGYLAAVKDYPDLTQVFHNLRGASLEAHLPAFEAAAASQGQLNDSQMQSLPMPRGGRGKGKGKGKGKP